MTHRLRLTAIALTLLITAHGTAAQAQSDSEYAVKASFVFNVATFVEWPAATFLSPSAPIKLTLIAGHPIPEFVKAMSTKAIRGRTVTVEIVERGDQVGPTQIVFVAADAIAELPAALKQIGTKPVLTIAEHSIDTPSGAVIAVGVSQTRLAFAVNLDAADAAELKISPNLLKLAKSVRSARARTK